MCRHLKTMRIFILLFLIFLPSLALAQTSVGKFTFVQGRVDVLRSPASRAVPVKMGDAVFVGDIIRAKSASKAEITFTDGNIVRVAPNTRVEISEYMFDEAKGKGILNLSRGKVQAIIQEKIAKRIATFGEANRFEIHTPTAIAGARGCNFIVSFQRNSSSVFVIEGAVSTYNPKFPDMVVTVNTGYITTIPFDQPVQPARPATDAEKNMYKGDFAPGGSGENSEAEDTVISEATTGSAEPGAPSGPESPEPMGALTEIVQPPPITETQSLISETSDTIPPIISIDLSASPEAGPEAALNIAFSSNEPVTFSYKVDDGPWTPVSSPFSIPDVSEGPHVLQFKATDPAGNTNTTPAFPFYLSRYTLEGSATGTGSILTGSITEGEVAGILNQSWGGWNIAMSGSHKGYSSSSWQIFAGGKGYDSSGEFNGYWLDEANGSYSGNEMNGRSQLTYLTTDTLGKNEIINMDNVTGSFDTGKGTWQLTDIGAGTYTEKTLTFVSPMYSNIYHAIEDEGIRLDYTGYMSGLMGGAESLWSGSSTPVTLLGEYYHDGGSIWYSTEGFYSYNYNDYSYTTYDGGAYIGYLGGIDASLAVSWENELEGKVVALYIDPSDEYGVSRAGILKGDLTGTAYPDINMFGMEGDIYRTEVVTDIGIDPEYLNESVRYDSGYGSLSGSIGTDGWIKGLADDLYLETMSIVDYVNYIAQPWGIYRFIDYGDFSNPDGATDWTAKIGGDGYFGAYTYSDGESSYLYDDWGYWLANITDGIWGTNKLTGTVGGRFLTYTKLGTIEGDLLGTYNDDNTWQAVSLGTWSGEPLTFSGYWDYDTLYYNNEGKIEFGGYETGLIGGITSPWTGSADFLSMGEYYHYGEPAPAYIWNSPIYSYDAIEDDWTTIDGGAFSGYTGGIWKDGTMDGAAVALFIDPNGNAGYLTGDVSGSYYPDIMIWMADGQLTPTQMTTGLDPENFQTGWGYLDAHLAGNFDGSGSIEGWTGGDYAYGETLFFVKDDKGLPWGIYNLKLGYKNRFSDKPAGTADWSAMIGGQGTFSYEDDNGYWLAKVEGTWTDDGEIRGDLINGKYLTPTQMGSIGGPFFGINCHSEGLETWIGESIGTWSGEALAFGGSTSGNFMYWNGEGMSDRGLMQGLMGGTDSLYSGSSFLSLGKYKNLKNRTLWGMDIGTEGTSGWISDEGAFIGSIGGITLNENLEGLAIGLYIRPTETEGEYEAGYIYSDNAIGTLYPGIKMYELGGNLTAVSIDTTNISPCELYWGSESLNSGEDYGLITGDFTGSIGIESANLADQKWGVWRAGSGGTYTITPLEKWTATAEGKIYDGDWNIVGIWSNQTIGSQWSDNKLIGSTTGYIADINATPPITGITVGETLGTFDPNAYTWQAVQMGVWLETTKFLEMAANEAGRAKLQQLNIPCVEVGRATLTGSGNNFSNLNMTDTIFFAPNSGAPPTIWATGNVSGNYTAPPAINTTPIGLSGGGLKADFTFRTWDSGSGKWLSTINSTGDKNVVNGYNIQFNGVGAGTGATSGPGAISGTAAGTAR
jgi:hypothetical protein